MNLKAENINKTFEDKKVLDDVSISLNDNEIICLLGKSGVGKTTLFNILSGLLVPDEGKVLLDGEDITGKTGIVSYMLQKDLLLPHKTVIDNVSLPLVLKGMGKKVARKKAETYFRMFGIDGCEKCYPKELSGGMRQRAALLRTYLNSTNLVLLDEPFSALDTITREDMQNWYLNVSKGLSLSTIIITHDIDEAIILADRIYILTGTPGKIETEIKIDRNIDGNTDFVLTSQFTEYKRIIKNTLVC